MVKSEFEFKLDSLLNYAKEGVIETVDTLVLKAPSAKHAQLISKIKQQLIRAFKQQYEDNKNKPKDNSQQESSDDSMTPTMLMNLVYSSAVIDMGEFTELFKNLLLSGVCLIPPVTQTKKMELQLATYDSLSHSDLERLTGEYLLTFLLSSILGSTS